MPGCRPFPEALHEEGEGARRAVGQLVGQRGRGLPGPVAREFHTRRRFDGQLGDAVTRSEWRLREADLARWFWLEGALLYGVEALSPVGRCFGRLEASLRRCRAGACANCHLWHSALHTLAAYK